MEAWVYPNAPPGGGWQGVVAKRSGGSYGYGISFNSSAVLVYSSNGLRQFAYTVAPHQWLHVVGILAPDAVRLYVNWQLVGVQPGAAPAAVATSLKIGKSGAAPTWAEEYFNGRIDEVAIYNTALSADQISAHYQLGSAGPGVAAPATSFGYGYNALGNLTTGPLGTYSYGDAAHKHAATTAGSNTYAYDANGALVTRLESGVSYTHGSDLEGRQTSVTLGNSAYTFIYNGDGVLVAKQVNGTTVAHYSAGGLFEKDPSTGATRKSYSFGGRLIAFRDSTGLHYLHQDHLGSTALQTSSTGGYEGTQLRGPFGQPWRADGALDASARTDYQYTGQRSLERSLGSLDHYQAQWYSPVLGRVLSPDTIVPNATNPRDLNRYSYVGNNPVGRVDPTGHECVVFDGSRSTIVRKAVLGRRTHAARLTRATSAGGPRAANRRPGAAASVPRPVDLHAP